MLTSGTSKRVPFDLLIGDWIGVGIVFYPNGAYYSHISSRVRLYEKLKGSQRFLQYENFSGEGSALGQPEPPLPPPGLPDIFEGVVGALCRCQYKMTFEVHGKVAIATKMPTSIVSAKGFMSTNDNYSFIIRDTYNYVDPKTKKPKTEILTLHNNHYFPSSNTRQVFGTIANAEGQTVLLTSFIYTSYTPPEGHQY